MNKKGIASIIVFLVIIIILLVVIFVRIPIATFPLGDSNVVCVNGELRLKSSGDVFMDVFSKAIADLSETNAGLKCVIEANGNEFVTSQIECINNVPIVICKDRLYKAILMGKFASVPKEDSISSVSQTRNFSVEGINFTKLGDNVLEFCQKVCENERLNSYSNSQRAKYVECGCKELVYIDYSGEEISVDEVKRRICDIRKEDGLSC